MQSEQQSWKINKEKNHEGNIKILREYKEKF